MTAPACTESEFIELFRSEGANGTARVLKMPVRAVYRRRQTLEKKLGIVLNTPNAGPTLESRLLHSREHNPARREAKIDNGVVLVGSDAHYWPGIVSDGHKAFVKFCRELKPKIVVKNGDIIDGASISRFPPINFDKKPTVVQEIETSQERLQEIEDACKGAGTQFYWPLGNHDARFPTRLATVAPEFANVKGMQLKDHFPRWQPCWSVHVNDAVFKHRMKGGIHAPRNNTLNAGRSIFTGHLHSLKVYPLTDYDGTRWGGDCGTLADPSGPQFVDYLEDNPTDWRQGFLVLTFWRSKLLWPEVVHCLGDGKVSFRGKVIDL